MLGIVIRKQTLSHNTPTFRHVERSTPVRSRNIYSFRDPSTFAQDDDSVYRVYRHVEQGPLSASKHLFFLRSFDKLRMTIKQVYSKSTLLKLAHGKTGVILLLVFALSLFHGQRTRPCFPLVLHHKNLHRHE